MSFPNVHTVWAAGKTLLYPVFWVEVSHLYYLHKKNVEVPQNIKFFLAKDEKSPPLECKYAVKVDSVKKQTKNPERFIFILIAKTIIMKSIY